MELTPPVKAPGPVGPPEPAIPGSGQIGRQVAGLTATARAKPKDHTSQRALRPWCSTSGQLVRPPDKPSAPRDVTGCRGACLPGYHVSIRHILESIFGQVSAWVSPFRKRSLAIATNILYAAASYTLPACPVVGLCHLPEAPPTPPSSRMRFPTCMRAAQLSNTCLCPPTALPLSPSPSLLSAMGFEPQDLMGMHSATRLQHNPWFFKL